MVKEKVKESGMVIARGRCIASETSELAYSWYRKRFGKLEIV